MSCLGETDTILIPLKIMRRKNEQKYQRLFFTP